MLEKTSCKRSRPAGKDQQIIKGGALPLLICSARLPCVPLYTGYTNETITLYLRCDGLS